MTLAKEVDGDAARLLNKYRLCRKPSYEEYDKMKWTDREIMNRIHKIIETKRNSLRRLQNG